MSPEAKGRACLQCNKTVIDFTRSSDREIARHIKKNKDKECCGRFREGQLNRWLDQKKIRKNNFFYRVAAALWLLAASKNTSAQSLRNNKVELINKPVAPGKKIKVSNVSVSTDRSKAVFERSDIRIGGIRGLKSGKNDPMLVVDGAPAPLSYLSSIAPEDIDSETLLKGATGAAIYGQEGANGVIIINTKKRKAAEQQPCGDDKDIYF